VLDYHNTCSYTTDTKGERMIKLTQTCRACEVYQDLKVAHICPDCKEQLILESYDNMNDSRDRESWNESLFLTGLDGRE